MGRGRTQPAITPWPCPENLCIYYASSEQGLTIHVRKCKKVSHRRAERIEAAKQLRLHQAAEERERSERSVFQDLVSGTLPLYRSLHLIRLRRKTNDGGSLYMDLDPINEPVHPGPEVEVPIVSGRRSQRIVKWPKDKIRYFGVDPINWAANRLPAPSPELPSRPSQTAEMPVPEAGPSEPAREDRPMRRDVETGTRRRFRREGPDEFGLVRVYEEFPCEEMVRSADESIELENHTEGPVTNIYAPHPNYSTFLLNYWFWMNSATKTANDLESLRREVLLDPKFNLDDLRSVNFKDINRQLASSTSNTYFPTDDGWKEEILVIPVPLGIAPNVAHFQVPDFFHRSLSALMRSTFSSKEKSAGFVYEPFEVRYQPPTGEPEMGVYGELYNSKVWRDAHAEVQRLPREPDDTYPRAIAGLMLHSDGMSLTNFGGQSAWPSYGQWGNDSKTRRTCVNDTNLFQIAHIPKVSILLSQCVMKIQFHHSCPILYRNSLENTRASQVQRRFSPTVVRTSYKQSMTLSFPTQICTASGSTANS